MNGFIPNQLLQVDESHTASMDSGISSNPGNKGPDSCNTTPNPHANTNGHSNTVETEVEVHNPPEKSTTKITAISAKITSTGNREVDQRQLDALINDMMLDIQSMPDVTKPNVSKYTYTVNNAFESSSPPKMVAHQSFKNNKGKYNLLSLSPSFSLAAEIVEQPFEYLASVWKLRRLFAT